MGGAGDDELGGWFGADTLYGMDGRDTLLGMNGADSLLGGLGPDTLNGGHGADTLLGEDGTDRLAGGANADVFRWLRWSEGRDIVTDFSVLDDTIAVSASGFGGGLTAGTLPASRFVANTTGLATAAFGQFIWETDLNLLWWDMNGTATGGRVAIASLLGSPALTAADIVVT